MTFEYLLTHESERDGAIVGSIDLTIDFKVVDWGRAARLRYDEAQGLNLCWKPIEAPEIEVIGVWMEPAGNNVWVLASKDHEDWARDWADDNLDKMMDEARKP